MTSKLDYVNEEDYDNDVEVSINNADEETDEGVPNGSPNTGAETTTNLRKRKTIDESVLSHDDLQKLESRRAYNRQCAAKARKRNKTLISQLQLQVEELTKDKAELKRSNDLMRTQLELLEQQNRTLLMNQISARSLSQGSSHSGGFMPGNSMAAATSFVGNTLLPSNGLINPPSNVVPLPVGNVSNPMFNVAQQAGYDTGGIVASGVIGPGSSGGGVSTAIPNSADLINGNLQLESLSFLEQLQLQQQLQRQQQQFGAQLPPSATGFSVSNQQQLNNQDFFNNMNRNNNAI